MSGRDEEGEFGDFDRESGLAILDFFSDVDNLLQDEVIPAIKGIQAEVEDFSQEVNIDNLVVEETESEWEAISFSAKTESADSSGPGESSIVREMPFDGRIKEVIVGFPDGADEWVGIRVQDYQSAEKIFPSNPETGVFAANDYYDRFKTTYEVKKGEEIEVYHKNNDPNNERLVNCVVQVESEI